MTSDNHTPGRQNSGTRSPRRLTTYFAKANLVAEHRTSMSPSMSSLATSEDKVTESGKSGDERCFDKKDVDGKGEDEGSDFCFGGIEIPRSTISDNGVICPICKIFQKKVMSHIKKVHGEDHDFALEKEFRKYMSKLRQETQREAKKEREAEKERVQTGFAESRRGEQNKSRLAKKDCDPLKFAATRRGESMKMQEMEEKTRENKKKNRNDENCARKEREERKERQRASQPLQNPELKEETRRREQGRQRQRGEEGTGACHLGENAWTNLPLSFPPEHDIEGPTCLCYFCHAYNFRDEVVPLTAEQIAEIKRQTREENEEKNRRLYEEYLRERYEGQNQEDSEPDELFETESDLEEEVNWDLVKPDSLVQWALRSGKVVEEIRERIDWTLDKGTRPEERETRRSLKNFRSILDRQWLRVEKVMKWREGMTSSDCEDEEDKGFVKELVEDFQEELEDAKASPLLNRLCYSCHNP